MPMEENNFFSQLLMAKKPNGAPLFKNITIELICAACRDAKLLDCPHMASKLPSWKSAARGELVKTLMENNKVQTEKLECLQADSRLAGHVAA